MARKATRKARQAPAGINEAALTKGQLRKLKALRKSVGDTIGTRAFKQWLAKHKAPAAVPVDKNAAVIASTLEPLAKAGRLRIPRGGYRVRRGRGRVIVEAAGGGDGGDVFPL